MSQKARDLQCIKVEILKWTGMEANAQISDIFNGALRHCMPYDGTTNWITYLHNGRDINNANNYHRIIIVGSPMVKLFGCIMESKISALAEKMAFKTP